MTVLQKLKHYNYPQGRVTDHRINKSIYNLDAYMNGDIQEMMDAVIMAENAEENERSRGNLTDFIIRNITKAQFWEHFYVIYFKLFLLKTNNCNHLFFMNKTSISIKLFFTFFINQFFFC